MCRIALFPNKSKFNDISSFLEFLEKQNGGDGNGIAFFRGSKLQIVKGSKRKVAELLDVVPKNAMFLFHTRKQSVGMAGDFYTHPFITRIDGKKVAMVHNGTWSGYNNIKMVLALLGQNVQELTKLNDSQTIAKIIELVGFDAVRFIGNGVVVALKDKDSAIAYISGEFEAICFKKTFFYASETPYGYWRNAKYAYGFKKGTIIEINKNDFEVLEGEVIDLKKDSDKYCAEIHGYSRNYYKNSRNYSSVNSVYNSGRNNKGFRYGYF